MLLHKRTANGCTEEEWDEHVEEIKEHLELLYKIPNYDCVYIIRHTDELKSHYKPRYELGKLYDMFEQTEYHNRLNGYDLTINHEGYPNVNVYGTTYEYGTETVEIRVIPFDVDGDFMDISNFLISNGLDPITYARHQTIYRSIYDSLIEELYIGERSALNINMS